MKTILCFGDSNTWGYRYSEVPTDLPERFDFKTRWTGILSATLGSDYRVIEEGLNARTTVFEDPLWDHRSGKQYLPPCLDSHRPLDLVIVMLGTNDLKVRYSAASVDISRGLEVLVDIIQKSGAGLNGAAPETLLIAPVPVGTFMACDEPSWVGAQRKGNELPALYQNVANRRGCHFANSHSVMTVDDLDGDGLHISAKGHTKFAAFVGEKIKDILSAKAGAAAGSRLSQ